MEYTIKQQQQQKRIKQKPLQVFGKKPLRERERLLSVYEIVVLLGIEM